MEPEKSQHLDTFVSMSYHLVLKVHPQLFFRLMDTVLESTEQYGGAYFDDVLIFSDTW